MDQKSQVGSYPLRYLDRDETILELVRGRYVLHLGCVGFTDVDSDRRVCLAKQTLHAKISEISECVGIDYSESVVNECRSRGIFANMLAGDVERLNELDLKGPFEVIVAGDIIEHLSRPGDMLDGVRRLCSRETRVVITTPHAFGLPNVLRFAFRRFHDGAEHVMMFNIDNIRNLLARHGYVIERLDTCFQSVTRRRTLAFALGRQFLRVLPRFGGTLILVARITE